MIIHSGLYSSLRTNLPRKVMGFIDYPFIPKNDKTRDPRRYPGHREVLLYLQEFAREFEIEDMVRFETEVVHVGLVEDCKKWKVRSKKKSDSNDVEVASDFRVVDEIYDSVVISSGHFTEARLAEIPGKSFLPLKFGLAVVLFDWLDRGCCFIIFFLTYIHVWLMVSRLFFFYS